MLFLKNIVALSIRIYKYSIDQVDFYVPNIGIQAKIWDFDFASIKGIVENSKVNADWTKKINIIADL